MEIDGVVLTAGWGTADLAPELGLRPVRGQADWAEGVEGPAAAWGGYVAPTGSGLLFGATHDRDRTDVESDTEDTRRNLVALAARLPDLAERAGTAPLRSRAAVRATTADRLPLAGRLGERVWLIGGLGSRGFALAPLLAEHVAAEIADAPSPLPVDLAARVSPGRLAERAGRADRSAGTPRGAAP
jgi:tRNA 5-methylaminomethyl-2-thiouridine biosynthesis bifunctional protein